MRINPAIWRDVYDVAKVMREADYEEFSAVSWHDDREGLAKGLAGRFGGLPDTMCAWHGDEKVCIGAPLMTRPGVVTLLFFATDNFPKIGLAMTKWLKNDLFPRLEKAGIHRIEAVSLATHEGAHAWLRTIGLAQETGPMLGYGRRGEAFIQFARVSCL